jgi:hypothetical protein
MGLGVGERKGKGKEGEKGRVGVEKGGERSSRGRDR